MAINFENYHERARQFNEKYGLDFSYEEFYSTVTRHQSLEDGLELSKSAVSMENKFYLSRFEQMFKKASDNFIDRKIDSFKSEEMINDYENLMNGYRAAYREQTGNKLQPWYNKYKLASTVNESKPSDSYTHEYAQTRYLKGELRIRDMMAYRAQLENDKVTSPEKLSTIACYAEALKAVNSERPRWWRIIHPFRNNAEQRDAKIMENFVKNKLGEEGYENVLNEFVYDTKRLEGISEDLRVMTNEEKRKIENEQRERTLKEKINVEAANTEKTVDKGEQVKEAPAVSKNQPEIK